MIYPKIDTTFLRLLTDSTGIMQHSSFAIPNRNFGYTTDDNARALIVAIDEYSHEPSYENLHLISIYLGFMNYAYNPGHAFRNKMSYERVFLDVNGTDDCLGRSLWACGKTASSNIPLSMRLTAKILFDNAYTQVEYLRSPRAKSYALLGLSYYIKENNINEDFMQKAKIMVESLQKNYIATCQTDWKWYEPYLTYGNAIIPIGMIKASEIFPSSGYDEMTYDSLNFLTEILIHNEKLDLVGNDGWYLRGGERAIFDQQTIDAGYTIIMYVMAYLHYKEPKFKDLAILCYEWFFGRNRSKRWVYDTETHGCFDAITKDGVNLNQGAESITCLLMATEAIKLLK